MITIIDTGGSNLLSLLNAFERVGEKVSVSKDHSTILKSDKIILPGVGAAADAMNRIKERELTELIKTLKVPVLGICLGMQILYEALQEDSGVPGLALIRGEVKRFPTEINRPIPHMGWNTLSDISSPLFKGITSDTYFYFVHSYFCPDNEYSIARCNYGLSFTSAVNKDNFWGVQFHPEKSGAAGEKLLLNFLNI